MSSEWFKGTWGDLVELKYGKGLKNYKESNEEIPVFGTNGPVGFTSKALCDFPSIIIGRKGAYRGVHFSSVPFWVIDTAYFIVPKKDFNIKWAYYHLLTQDINALDSGSAIPSTSREDFYQLPANMPPRWIQDEIVNCLDMLNKKINLNSKSNQTLEQMAQAIFKSWFVDFDPVKAKMNGEQPEGMDRATASLFPEKLVESELGLIPEGWEVTNIGKVSECFDKKRIPLSKRQREQKKGSIPYYGATSVMDYVDEAIFDDIYLLIGEDGSVMKDDGTPFIQYIWGPAWVNNHAHVLQGIKSISTEQLMLFFQQTNINAYVTGAVQLKINQRNMNSIPFIKAPKEINERFYDVVAPLYAKIRAIKEENEQLAKLRDTLLPKLLSGEIELGQSVEVQE